MRPSRLFIVCCVAGATSGAFANDDSASLVQRAITTDPVLQGDQDFVKLFEPNTTGPVIKMYKMLFTESYGSDHICLTEMQFYDEQRQPMTARFKSMSSCYGCPVACENCKSAYGQPSVLFDMVYHSEESDAWSCSGVGSFVDGAGTVEVVFSLAHRPAKVTMRNSDSSGGWVPKAWQFQEQMADGSWETILKTEQAQLESASAYVQTHGSSEVPFDWPIAYKKCGGESDTIDLPIETSNTALHLESSVLDSVNVAYTGRYVFDYSNGISVDGNFGHVSNSQGQYIIRQVTLNFGSNHRLSLGGTPRTSEGEMHLILQKVGSPGIFDLAVLAIMLQLPQETGVAMLDEEGNSDKTESFFEQLLTNNGTLVLPRMNEPRTVNASLDMTAFTDIISGPVFTSDCNPDVPWYFALKPAYVSGAVVAAFKAGPPPPTPAPPVFNTTNGSAAGGAVAYPVWGADGAAPANNTTGPVGPYMSIPQPTVPPPPAHVFERPAGRAWWEEEQTKNIVPKTVEYNGEWTRPKDGTW